MIGDFFAWLVATMLMAILLLFVVMGWVAIIHYTRTVIGISSWAIVVLMVVALVGAGFIVARLMRYG